MHEERITGNKAVPRICMCVMMNHPFPANIPLLRRIYAGRFTDLRFLIPFERLDDDDVITVYRGSYVHAGYVTDAHSRLREIDCDYFLFVHDDVLLNPKFDERSFFDRLPLGPNDGFIPWVCATPARLGDWVWYYTILPSLLHPKSLLFGSGIERETLLKHLPPRERIVAGFERSGAPYSDHVLLDIADMGEGPPAPHSVEDLPSIVLLDGFNKPLEHGSAAQQRVDKPSVRSLRSLTAAMAAAARRNHGSFDNGALELPIPLTASAYFTDCYVLPRSRLDDFAHHMGVAAAANLFVEIIAPTLLHAVCDRVWTAAHLELDFEGFHHPRPIQDFERASVLAIHPFKLSPFREPERQDALMAVLDGLRLDSPVTTEMMDRAGLGAWQRGWRFGGGWHGQENWGRWAAAERAIIRVSEARAGTAMRLHLVAPLAEGDPDFAGDVRVDGTSHPFVIVPLAPTIVEIALEKKAVEQPLDIEVTSSRLVCPGDRDPSVQDRRKLGVGIFKVELT